MIIETTQHDNYTLAVITAREASLRNADQFKEEIMALIDSGVKNVILNFEQVTYIDSSFLGSIVAALKHAIAIGSDIYLVALQKDIYDLLCLIRMNKVFKIFNTTDEAIATLK